MIEKLEDKEKTEKVHISPFLIKKVYRYQIAHPIVRKCIIQHGYTKSLLTTATYRANASKLFLRKDHCSLY
jgi:hypothetical protein